MPSWPYSLIEYRTPELGPVIVGLVVYDSEPAIHVLEYLPPVLGNQERAAMAVRSLVNRLRRADLGTDDMRIEAFRRRQANAVRLSPPRVVEAPSAREALSALLRPD